MPALHGAPPVTATSSLAVILVDRCLDLATPLMHSDHWLDAAFEKLPRGGGQHCSGAAVPSATTASSSGTSGAVAGISGAAGDTWNGSSSSGTNVDSPPGAPMPDDAALQPSSSQSVGAGASSAESKAAMPHWQRTDLRVDGRQVSSRSAGVPTIVGVRGGACCVVIILVARHLTHFHRLKVVSFKLLIAT